MKMNDSNKLPIRKRNRLKDYDYRSNGAYFITICTKDRKNIFWAKEQPDFVGEDIMSRETWFTICEDTWFTTYTTNKFGAKA